MPATKSLCGQPRIFDVGLEIIMRLFESIIDANHRAVAGDASAGLHPAEFADALPVVALTCIDPRLNAFFPNALALPAEEFIWLRNAGNIITGTLSSTMRSSRWARGTAARRPGSSRRGSASGRGRLSRPPWSGTRRRSWSPRPRSPSATPLAAGGAARARARCRSRGG